MSVSAVLSRAGLSHLIRKFDGVSYDLFRSLLIQDYEKFGISDMNDKQALFRLIQTLSSQESPLVTPEASAERILAEEQQALVDLNEDDTEFLTDDFDIDGFGEQGFFTSPAQAGSQKWSDNAVHSAVAALNAPDPPKIRVIVRKRPLNKKELDRGDYDVLECESRCSTVFVNEPKVKVDLTKFVERHCFSFDDVFDETVDNQQVYSQAIQPLISTIFKKGKGTCFAYGQTGSGKTFTMQPLPLRAADDILKVLSISDYKDLALHVSCYEIYGGKLFDLLNGRKKLDVREDSKRRVQIIGVKEFMVDNIPVLQQLIDHSANARSTGSTGANDESSRSHSIMVFALRDMSAQPNRIVGKLSFIDLAGSERGADTYDNDKQTRLEGAEINKSLLALKECIRALDSDARHIPFRGSKLTEVLRDSFIGKNARTVMIANVSPNSSSCEHTLNTLRYADRVKEIRKPGSAPAGGASTAVTATATAGDLAAALQRLQPPRSPPPLSAATNSTAAPPQAAEKTKSKASARLAAAISRKATIKDTSKLEQSQNANGNIRGKPPTAPKSPKPPPQEASGSSDMEDVLSAIMTAEDDLIAAHRQHIEENMASVRQEMNILGDLDGTAAGDIEVYASELSDLLQKKAASVAALQQRVHSFCKLLQAAMEKQGSKSDF